MNFTESLGSGTSTWLKDLGHVWRISPVPFAWVVLALGVFMLLSLWGERASFSYLEVNPWLSPDSGALFILASLALLVGRPVTAGRVLAARFIALLILAYSLLVLIQLALGLRLLPERLADALNQPNDWNGHVSAMAAVGFMGVGLFFQTVRRSQQRVIVLGSMLLTLSMGLIGLLGWAGGLTSYDFLGHETSAMTWPTAVGLMLLAVAQIAYGLECGAWRWFMRRRADRRIALLGGGMLFAISLITGVLGILASAHMGMAEHEHLMQYKAKHAADAFRQLVDASVLDLQWRALMIQAQLGRDSEPEKIREVLAAELQGGKSRHLVSLHFEGPRGLKVTVGQPPPPANAEFNVTWNLGDGRLVWAQGLRVVYVSPLRGGSQLVLMADIDQDYRAFISSFSLGNSGEARICTSVKQGATCLPSRLTPQVISHPLHWQGKGLSMSLALTGEFGYAQALDYRAIRVSSAYLPLASDLGLVLKIDAHEALTPIRQRVWLSFLLIMGVTLAGTFLFQRVMVPYAHALVQWQHGLRMLVEHLPVSLVMVDEQGRIASMNALAETNFGYTPSVMTGVPVARLFLDWGSERSHFQPTHARPLSLQCVRRSGESFAAEVGIGRYAFRQRRYTVLMISDMTQRQRRTQELEIWEQTFTHADWGIVISNPDSNTIMQINPQFARMHGYTVRELTGQPIANIFAPAERGALPAHIALAHSRGHHSFESVHLRRDGSEFPVRIDVATVCDEKGTIRYRMVYVQDISGRKAMQMALRDAENALRLMLDSQNYLICRWAPNFCLTYANRACAQFFGKDPQELLGERLLDLWPDPAQHDIEHLLQDLVTHPREAVYVHPVRKANDELHDLHWRHSPLWDAQGALIGFQSVGHDVTGQQALERARRAIERHQRALCESRMNPIWLLAEDGTVLELNQAVLGLCGTTRDAVLGLPFWNAPWSRGLVGTEERLKEVVVCAAQGSTIRMDVDLQNSQGERVYFELECSPFIDRDNQPLILLVVEGRDVTTAQHAQRSATEREMRLQTLASILPGMVFEFALEQDVLRPTYISEGVVGLCGIRGDDLLSGKQHFLDCVHSDDKSAFTISLLRAAYLGADWDWTGRLFNAQLGAVRWVNICAKPRVSDTQVIWDAVALNITALKENELEIAASRQALRELSAHREAVREDERKYIAREIHDELGQNLTALRMGLAVLEAQSVLTPANPAIGTEAVRLKDLVDQSISVVRSIATSLRPAALEMGLSAALIWLADEFQQRSGVPCNLNLDSTYLNLPDSVATGLFRIVQESLTNVARHAHARNVHILLRKLGCYVVLEIRDDGQGFDQAAQAGQRSYGLLGISERTLMLGGKMTLFSTPGHGTVISVNIPLSQEAEILS